MSNRIIHGPLQPKVPTLEEEPLPSTVAVTVLVEYEESSSQSTTTEATQAVSQRHFATPPRVVRRLKERGVPSPLSRSLVKWQEGFSPDRRGGAVLQFHATATNQEVFASPGNVYIKGKAIGRGAEAQVFSVLQFPRDGSSPERKVAKFARRSFQSQHEAQLLVSPDGKKYINTFESTSRVIGKSLYIGIVAPADCDLEHLKLNTLRFPLLSVLRISRDIAAGMAALHRSDQIHRDLKPANIVVIKKGEEAQAQVTDFGLATTEKSEKHMTALTPQFAPDFIWENSVQQRNRSGIQKKEADVFSLGRTLVEGGVVKLLKHYQKETGVSFEDLLQKMKPAEMPIPRTDEELLDLSEAAVGPVIIAFSGYIPSTVLLYPSQEDLRATLGESIARLEPHLPPQGIEALRQYVEFVVSLQSNDPSLLPTMEEAEERLQTLLTIYNPIPLPSLFDEVEATGADNQGNTEPSGRKRSQLSQSSLPSRSLPVETKKRRVKVSKAVLLSAPSRHYRE
ncbi:MAG: protein kinase family protein [Simkaniaceae bacterium]|nr:MAG: protein kinase family protein [Simkaniaceae bacterium]